VPASSSSSSAHAGLFLADLLHPEPEGSDIEEVSARELSPSPDPVGAAAAFSAPIQEKDRLNIARWDKKEAEYMYCELWDRETVLDRVIDYEWRLLRKLPQDSDTNPRGERARKQAELEVLDERVKMFREWNRAIEDRLETLESLEVE